jgi:hypothetical protein
MESQSRYTVSPVKDILYCMVNQLFVLTVDGDTSPKSLVNDLQIRFRHHTSELGYTWDDPTLKSMDVLAGRVASWQYKKTQEVLL